MPNGIEGFRRKKEEQQVQQYEQSPEGIPPTVVEILQDPVYSEMLFILLENNTNLREKLLKGETLEKDELERLSDYRKNIKEALDKSKEVLSILTPERIKLVASLSSDFANLVGLIGAEKTYDFLHKYLAIVYIEDPDRFNDLQKKINAIQTAEQNLQRINEQIINFAKEHNIPQEVIDKFYELAAENTLEANTFLRNKIRENLSLIGRIRNWMGEHKIAGGREFVEEYVKGIDKIEEIEKELNKINDNLGEIGNMLAGAIFESEEARRLLSQVIKGRTIEQPGFSFREAGNLVEKYGDPRSFEEEWDEFLKDKNIEWNNIQDDNEKNKYKNEFRTKFMSRYKKFGRFFDWLFDPNKGIIGKNLETFLSSKQ